MKRKSPSGLYVLLALIVTFSIIGLSTGSLIGSGLFQDPERLWTRLVRPLIRITFFVSIGLFVAQVIEGMGWTARLAVMARPFMRWGHLSDQIGAVFTTAFISGMTSLSMLSSFHKDGILHRREITIAVLLNTFPSFFLHLPTTFFIIISLLGKAGIVYLGLTFGAALLRLGFGLTCARFLLPESSDIYRISLPGKRTWKDLLHKTADQFRSRLVRMIIIILPMYMLVLLISDLGFFDWLRHAMALKVSSALIPIEAVSLVVFSLMAEFTSGYAAAGAMLQSGELTLFQTVFALLLGNIIAAPVRALRHQMPYYMGIFTPGLGVFLMVVSQAFRVGSLIVMGLLFYLITFM